MYRHTLCTLCFPQIIHILSQSWTTTSTVQWGNFSCAHKTRSGASVQLQPHNDSQQPMTTAFFHICKYTWHCAPTSTALSRRSPTEQAGEEDWSQNNGPTLNHIRWLSVTCGVQPKAKGHHGSAALYNVTLGLANSQAISLAAWELAWGDGGRKRAG